MNNQDYLSIGEVAKRMGVNATTVYRLAQKGGLPAFKVGSQWRFSPEQLDSWVVDQVTIEWLKAEDRLKSAKFQTGGGNHHGKRRDGWSGTETADLDH